jgi:hypothetical protein
MHLIFAMMARSMYIVVTSTSATEEVGVMGREIESHQSSHAFNFVRQWHNGIGAVKSFCLKHLLSQNNQRAVFCEKKPIHM